jgi:four helix bundle protein
MDYRDLVFYQKAQEVVIGINNEIKKWPKGMQVRTISRQLFRSATSIGANIAEGHGRHIGPEYIHFLTIARGSANEVDHWLNTTLECGIGSKQEIMRLIQINNEVRKMISVTITTLQKKQRNLAIHESHDPYSLNSISNEKTLEK